MGIQSALGISPVKAMNDLLGSAQEKHRRTECAVRLAMYQDSCEEDTHALVNQVFNSEAVRRRTRPFVSMGCGTSVFRRVVDEVARHVYNPEPARRISSVGGSFAYQQFIMEARVNQRLDQGARLLEACNAVALMPRWASVLEAPVLDILTPDMFSVISHPDDPTRELGISVDIYVPGSEKPYREIWDDTVIIRTDPEGRPVPVGGEYVRPNPYGVIPAVIVHKRERWGTYWDLTSGGDLVAAQRSVNLLSTLVLKLHKSQGEKQIVVTGDTASTIENQTLDGEGALVGNSDVSITSLDLRSSAEHYNATIDATISRVAANYGISRERLNAAGQTTPVSGDAALYERRAELLQVWAGAEQRLFRLCKTVFAGTPVAIPRDDTLIVDFREIEARVSMADQLDLWERMLSMGLKSVPDMVMSMNREISTSDEADAEVTRNLESWAKWIEVRRKLNAPDSTDPGRSPEDNGRMGPDVRDGVDRLAERGEG
jgi:hypothetical protein